MTDKLMDKMAHNLEETQGERDRAEEALGIVQEDLRQTGLELEAARKTIGTLESQVVKCRQQRDFWRHLYTQLAGSTEPVVRAVVGGLQSDLQDTLTRAHEYVRACPGCGDRIPADCSRCAKCDLHGEANDG